MMSLSQVEKIKKYIREDRPRRLRTYVRKHHIDLSRIVLNKGRNLLHYCCKHPSGTIIKYLLSEDVSCLVPDFNGDTAIHTALHSALRLEDEGSHRLTTQCYTEVILPLIEKYPGSLEIENKSGETCRKLLHILVQRREADQDDQDSEPYQDEDPGLDERAWRDKLADEYQHEYSTTWGKYEQDFTNYTTKNETYDDWADRIRSEYFARKNAQKVWNQRTESTRKKSKRKHSDTNDSEKDDLDAARAKMRKKFEENKEKEREIGILKKRMKYEERYKNLLDSESVTVLRYGDVPWPSVKGHDTDMSVLFDGLDQKGPEYRRYLRDQQIRWHPDKFMQRFGRYLDSSDKERIVQRVTALSQNLNKLVK